ncbi:HEAT repeat-containing protein 1 [Ischnura elegans]|uniref:HEAT repeat-containing protein 1 n=1 Tax=Ischnura elegans TaxID=197161 RepID=UPI001ED8AD88|nr:HEAT repeat-containing protein 1 [Ischnura elegans]
MANTSLAQQLRRLAVPQTSILLSDKKRASLLFDPKEASNLDPETVLEIGLSGLRELAEIGGSEFRCFEKDLFDSTSVGVERAVLTRDANEALDERIDTFLILLSPYALLKPCHKALEWLIRRFHIQDYNQDKLIFLYLPYHESKIFVRVLQLIDVSSPSHQWHWLHAISKSGTSLPHTTIVGHASSNNAFLLSLSEHVLFAIKMFKEKSNMLSTLFGFYCTTVVGAIEHVQRKRKGSLVSAKEAQLQVILPCLLKGLSSTIPDFACASFMIVSSLARGGNMARKLLHKVINKIVKNCDSGAFMLKEATALLALLCETQSSTDMAIFPPSSLSKMMACDVLTKVVAEAVSISAVAHVGNFAVALIAGLLPLAKESANHELAPATRSALEHIISTLPLDKNLSEAAIRLLVNALASIEEEEKKGDFSDQVYSSWLNDLLQSIEKKYPTAFDSVVQSLVLTRGAEASKVAFIVGRLLGITVLNKGEFGALVARLCHPEASIRVAALGKLGEMEVAALKSEEDRDTLRWIVEQRLLDDSAEVVEGTLALPFLNSIFGRKRMTVEAINIVRMSSKNLTHSLEREKWIQVTLSAIRVMFAPEQEDEESHNELKDSLDQRFKILFSVFPFLCPTTEKELEVTKVILKLPCAEPILESLWLELSGINDLDGYCCAAFNHLKSESFIAEEETEMLDLVETLSKHCIVQDSEDTVSVLIAILMLSAIAKESSLSVKTCIFEIASKVLHRSKVAIARNSEGKPIKHVLTAETWGWCMATAKRGVLPLQAVLHTFAAIFYSPSKTNWFPQTPARDNLWHCHNGLLQWSTNDRNQPTVLAVKLFDALAFGCFLRKVEKSLPRDVADAQMLFVGCLKDFFDAHLPQLPHQLNFLSCLWVSHEIPLMSRKEETLHKSSRNFEKFTIGDGESKEHVYYHSVSQSGLCVSPELQIRAIRLAEALISKAGVPTSWLLETAGMGEAVIPSILVACTSPVSSVRAATLSLLQSLVCTVGANLPSKGNLYTLLLKAMVEQREEIIMHSGQLPLILYEQLSPEPTIVAMHSSDKRQRLAVIRDSLFSILTPDSSAPCYMKRALLQMLDGIRSLDLLKHLGQLGMALLEEGQAKYAMDEFSTDCFASIISRFDGEIAPHMADFKKGGVYLWNLFKSSLSDSVTELPATDDVRQFQFPGNDFMKTICPAILCLQQVTREFYEALPSQKSRQELLCIMIDLASQSNTKPLGISKDFPLAEATALAAKSTIKKLSIDANMIMEELERMLEHEDDAGKKRTSLRKTVKRVGYVLTPKDLQSQSWMRGVVLLEIMQTKRKVINPSLLLPLLFEILKVCLQLKHQEPVEYTKQLILACALHCLRKVDDRVRDDDDDEGGEGGPNKIDKNALDVETVVHCIRSTQNPHTHRHALLLLSRAAELVPDSVLHNVMAIFAFVGTSMVRQDDEYSFEVIARTIESVVPVLTKVDLQRSLQRKRASESSVEFLKGPGAAGILKVTRVFADAVPDVPPHRRLPLYVKLVETVGWDVGLPQLLLLVLEGHVLHGKAKSMGKDEGGSGSVDPRIELANELVREAPSYFIILALLRMVEFVNLLPADKESGANGKIVWHRGQLVAQAKELSHDFNQIFDLKVRTGAQLRHFKHSVVSFLLDVISEPQVVAKVSLVDGVDSKMMKDRPGVDKLFQELIKVLLGYIATVAGELEVAGGSTSSGRYWKAMQQKCHQVLEKVNNLLPGPLFLDVVRGLLGYQLPSVRRKAADILSNRLLALLNEKGSPAEVCASFSEDDRASLMGILLGPLLELMHSREEIKTDLSATRENDLNCQVSLFTVKLLVRILGPVEKPSVFKHVLSEVCKVAAGALGEKGSLVPSSSSVLACAVLCIAEICSVLKVSALTELNNFMPILLSALNSNMKDSINTTAQIGVVTAVQRVVESIPNFISPYLRTLLVRLCLFTSQQSSGEVVDSDMQIKNEQLSLKLASIMNKVSSAIPLRVLIPAVSDSYAILSEGKYPAPEAVIPLKDGVKRMKLKSEEVGTKEEPLPKECKCHAAIVPLMDLFSHSLSKMTRADVNSHLVELEHFFLRALDFRAKNRHEESGEMVENVEASVISALVVLVMKLSETLFRSLYYRLFEWTSGDKAPHLRAITFYRFSSKCAECLKGLFVLFAGHCIRHAASLLERNNLAKIKSDAESGVVDADVQHTPAEEALYFGEEEDGDGLRAHSLITCILSMLHSVFLYEDGTGRFVTSGRFETLMPPLVDQLENLVGGIDLFQERCSVHVVPTLVKLAVSAADDSLWKQLNYQILLKTRHSNSKVRLAGLSALLELGKQLGEDFLPLLPETVPFLAELMEDEEEEVEAAAQKAIATLSDVLGEPLQKYL